MAKVDEQGRKFRKDGRRLFDARPKAERTRPPAVALLGTADGKKLGRPSEYKPEYDDLVERMSLLGLALEELGHFFGVSPQTILLWDKKYPSFSQARARGRDEADALVARALFKRATGMKIPDIHFSSYQGDVKQTEYERELAPDVQACILWLSNRRPKEWSLSNKDPSKTEGGEKIVVEGGLPDREPGQPDELLEDPIGAALKEKK